MAFELRMSLECLSFGETLNASANPPTTGVEDKAKRPAERERERERGREREYRHCSSPCEIISLAKDKSKQGDPHLNISEYTKVLENITSLKRVMPTS